MSKNGCLVCIKRSLMKRKRTFDRHANEITKLAKKMWSSAYYFPPGLKYMPSDLPVELAEKYKIQVSAHDKARDLVKLALRHGVPPKDIQCWDGKLVPLAFDELIRVEMAEIREEKK